MNPAYLVDTDWVIHYLNGQRAIVSRLHALQPEGLAISTITLAELYEGVYYSYDPKAREHDLDDFLLGVLVLGVDEETCKVFGVQRGRLRQKKKTVADFDLLIGSTALRHKLVVLTNNRKHFEVIEGLQIETLEIPPKKKPRSKSSG